MPKSHNDLTNDDILNAVTANTAEMSRYDRILQARSTEATMELRDNIGALTTTIDKASGGLKATTDQLLAQYKDASALQTRQQTLMIRLTLAIVAATIAYTFVTAWSVMVMRDGNEIQRALLQQSKGH
jgi:hypothetical protein